MYHYNNVLHSDIIHQFLWKDRKRYCFYTRVPEQRVMSKTSCHCSYTIHFLQDSTVLHTPHCQILKQG